MSKEEVEVEVEVVVDSSALIPLAWVGHLDFIPSIFDDIRILKAVKEETVVEGGRGASAIESFFEDSSVEIKVENTSKKAEKIAKLEGITVTDAGVFLLAKEMEKKGKEAILLVNDRGLIEVARTHNVECLWITTLLLKCRKEGILTSEKASNILYNLVSEGMNLDPKIYSKVQKKLQEINKKD